MQGHADGWAKVKEGVADKAQVCGNAAGDEVRKQSGAGSDGGLGRRVWACREAWLSPCRHRGATTGSAREWHSQEGLCWDPSGNSRYLIREWGKVENSK